MSLAESDFIFIYHPDSLYIVISNLVAIYLCIWVVNHGNNKVHENHKEKDLSDDCNQPCDGHYVQRMAVLLLLWVFLITIKQIESLLRIDQTEITHRRSEGVQDLTYNNWWFFRYSLINADIDVHEIKHLSKEQNVDEEECEKLPRISDDLVNHHDEETQCSEATDELQELQQGEKGADDA